MQQEIATQVGRRRTFAIISHPDAGKTTLTEKLLLYGGAIHLAGSVKARKAERHATSDWMELEKQRGISVTSSVLQFEYNGYAINLLDTPGHQDFSEDTYRTLAAVDSAIMLIDAGKGVEEQTRKLFQVCRLRGIPIFTFVNKMDRFGKPPLELLTEIEEVLGIRSTPINWPVGMGNSFRGVYDRLAKSFHIYQGKSHGVAKAAMLPATVDDATLAEFLGKQAHAQLEEEIALLDIAGNAFDAEQVAKGELTPVFFGSALTNFGVQSFIDRYLQMAPAPVGRVSDTGWVDPLDESFSGFVFKIQANMNPAHRDRVAFIRVVSGCFTRGMNIFHVRLGKNVRLSQPQQFLAQDRTMVEEAYAGDIIGVFDPGVFQIGDTLTVGQAQHFAGIPYFSPEYFATVQIREALKRKQLTKGLDQLAQEGAIQLFRPVGWGATENILGAVGSLQFDVLAYRLKHEYGVDVELVPLPYHLARWVEGDGKVDKIVNSDSTCVMDRAGRLAILFKSEWALRWAERNCPGVILRDTAAPVLEEADWVVAMR